MNVTLYGNIFTDVIKIRILKGDYPGLSEGAPNDITSMFTRARQREMTYTRKRRRQCDHWDTDWNEVATNQGMTQVWKARNGFFPRASGGSGTADTLNSCDTGFGLLASKLWENYLLFYALQFVVISYSSHRKHTGTKGHKHRILSTEENMPDKHEKFSTWLVNKGLKNKIPFLDYQFNID